MPPRPRNAWSDDEAREYASMLDLANDAVLVLDLVRNGLSMLIPKSMDHRAYNVSVA